MIVEDLASFEYPRDDFYLVATSGCFDPLHAGHLRLFRGAIETPIHDGRRPLLFVLINSDHWIRRYKIYGPCIPEDQRATIIDDLREVGAVSIVDGGDDRSVSKFLRILQPRIFAKGGDIMRLEQVPEIGICREIGCEILIGIGGKKIWDSTETRRRMAG